MTPDRIREHVTAYIRAASPSWSDVRSFVADELHLEGEEARNAARDLGHLIRTATITVTWDDTPPAVACVQPAHICGHRDRAQAWPGTSSERPEDATDTHSGPDETLAERVAKFMETMTPIGPLLTEQAYRFRYAIELAIPAMQGFVAAQEEAIEVGRAELRRQDAVHHDAAIKAEADYQAWKAANHPGEAA